MAIDWHNHFTRIEAEIVWARRRAVRRVFANLPTRYRHECEAAWIRTLAAMLASRHIPAEVRAATPAIPWRAIARLAAHVDWCTRNGEPLPGSVIDTFNKRQAVRLVPALRKLREHLAMTDADGNERTGILDVSPRGGFVHVMVRVPESELPRLRTCIGRLYEGRPAPTLDDVRTRLAAASARLRAHGVTDIWVYGSVARGCASPASDVDLAYRSDERPDFQEWASLTDAFEEILGRVVDGHLLGAGVPAPTGAVVVWADK